MDHVLDARGLKCPLPVLKARKALREVPVGEVLTVLATDPGAPADFAHFCETTGNELAGSEAAGDHLRITIRRIV
jgi:tRNA 2-thiouridine synthesizing protein A